MEINMWIQSCKVRILPWVDGKTIYCNVQYYRPGQSIEQPPVWDRSVYITDNEAGRNLAYNFTDSLVNHIIGMNIAEGQKVVLTA